MLSNEAIPLDHNGIEGVWFPAPTAKRVLADVQELRLLRERLALIDTQLALKEERIEILALKLAGADEIADNQEQIAEIRGQRLAEIEQESKSWYRSPFLWLGVGVVVGVVGAGVLVGAVD